jgi:hypothetical protein
MEFHNPGYLLKPGMYAEVTLDSVPVADAVLVPESAVLRSGDRATVFIRRPEGRFLPRDVKLGLQGEGHVLQVREGLQGGEELVLSAQFLIDSESQLREAIEKMLEPAGPSGPPPGGADATMPDMPNMPDMPGTAPSGAAVASVTTTTAPARWVCPMPEHAGVAYDAPARCPLCGMTLVPDARPPGEAAAPRAPPLYWTCPMPAHADVRAAGPGRCPRCGMTLVPVDAPPPDQPPPAPGAGR